MLGTILKSLFVIIGTISLILGTIGLFLPVLPTTPFLLLSSFCYLRSSKRLYNWLMTRKVVGAYLYNYITYKAVPRRTKLFAILFLWCTLVVSILLIENWHVRLFLVAVGIGVSIHLTKLKTIEKFDLTTSSEEFPKNAEDA